MGSGCNSSCNNFFVKSTPDSDVKYTGPAITALGICTGDTLKEVEAVILQKLIDYSTGVGISLPNIDLTTCAAFSDCITCCNNQCRDLPCLLDCYKTAICSLFTEVDTLSTSISALLDGPYNPSCISGLSTNPTLAEIIQKWLVDYCALKTTVTALSATVTTLSTNLPATIGNFLLNAITTCTGNSTVIKTGTGASANIAFKGFTPIGGIIPYAGPITGKVDSEGRGLTGTDLCGWHLCNGLNGTVDLREQVPVGVGAGAMGGGTLPSNASGANYSLLATVGQATVQLSADESGTAAHGHSITDNGHAHPFEFQMDQATANNLTTVKMNPLGTGQHTSWYNAETGLVEPPSDGAILAYIGRGKTGITVNSNTGDVAKLAHENRQPSTALYYIQRIA